MTLRHEKQDALREVSVRRAPSRCAFRRFSRVFAQYETLLSHKDDVNTTALRQAQFFYQGGPDKDGAPVFYVIMGRSLRTPSILSSCSLGHQAGEEHTGPVTAYPFPCCRLHNAPCMATRDACVTAPCGIFTHPLFSPCAGPRLYTVVSHS